MALLSCTGRWCRNGTRWCVPRPSSRALASSPVAAANIAGAAGYSGRGRRPVAATPSARLFSEHRLQHTHFLRANIPDVNERSLFRDFIGDHLM